MTNATPPSGITVNQQTREMIVIWEDGHVSIYPFYLLRAGCPCASCRGGHDRMGPEPDEEVFSRQIADLTESPRTRIEQVEAVGSYAITITWKDGHHFGIYNWYYLRKLCPCQECRGKK